MGPRGPFFFIIIHRDADAIRRLLDPLTTAGTEPKMWT